MLHVDHASLGILLFYDAHKKPPAHRYIFIIIYNDDYVNLYYNNMYDKRINLKLQFPLLHIIPAGEDFYF